MNCVIFLLVSVPVLQFGRQGTVAHGKMTVSRASAGPVISVGTAFPITSFPFQCLKSVHLFVFHPLWEDICKEWGKMPISSMGSIT